MKRLVLNPSLNSRVLRNLYTIYLFIIFLSYLLITIVFTSLPLYAQKTDKEKLDVSNEIKNLKSKDVNKKLSAIEKLGKANDQRAITELRAQLKKEKNSSQVVRQLLAFPVVTQKISQTMNKKMKKL